MQVQTACAFGSSNTRLGHVTRIIRCQGLRHSCVSELIPEGYVGDQLGVRDDAIDRSVSLMNNGPVIF